MLLEVDRIAFAYHRRPVLHEVSFSIERGQWLTILGPNGAGKSTLLRLILGLLRPSAGEVRCEGQALRSLSRQAIAQRMALVPQQTAIPFGFTVREVVAMGRTPYLGRFEPAGARDRECVEQALGATEMLPLAERPITELSGGEQQRVYLARALAQDTPLLVLDEPANNLDLHHQRALLQQVQARQQQGVAVISVLHDLNIAARYAERVLVLDGGRVAALGPTAQALTPELLSRVLRVDVQRIRGSWGDVWELR